MHAQLQHTCTHAHTVVLAHSPASPVDGRQLHSASAALIRSGELIPTLRNCCGGLWEAPHLVCGCWQLITGSMPAHTHMRIRIVSTDVMRIMCQGWEGALTCAGSTGMLPVSAHGEGLGPAPKHLLHTDHTADIKQPLHPRNHPSSGEGSGHG